MTHVIINGAKGNMGKEAVIAVTNDEHLTLSASIDKEDNLEKTILTHQTDVVVDLTHPYCVYENVKIILTHNCHAIVGTTGLTEDQLSELDKLAQSQNKALIVCPNFSISAILTMKFAADAAKFFDRCEIIEYHHDKKADAPSGTAINTAQLIHQKAPSINKSPLNEKEIISGSRGGSYKNIPIHAIRLPGIVANQEVLFGTQGQSLSIRQDTISREAFMPGLLLAIKASKHHVGLVYGLENILNLSN